MPRRRHSRGTPDRRASLVQQVAGGTHEAPTERPSTVPEECVLERGVWARHVRPQPPVFVNTPFAAFFNSEQQPECIGSFIVFSGMVEGQCKFKVIHHGWRLEVKYQIPYFFVEPNRLEQDSNDGTDADSSASEALNRSMATLRAGEREDTTVFATMFFELPIACREDMSPPEFIARPNPNPNHNGQHMYHINIRLQGVPVAGTAQTTARIRVVTGPTALQNPNQF